jgi:hypothetical protein
MSNPTTPFNWQMPTNTDLVTDLPADFEVFGQAVATSMADLLGGTSGQILSKATNADMDFTWINNDQGDITGITATSPLTGGGTSGAITVGIQASSTTQSGAVQLTDSTSSTSTTTAATPNSVKTSYDLAAAAVPKSTVTTAGDVIYATGSGAVTRLGIGTANQILRVNSGATAPEWATPASSTSGLTLIAAQAIGTAVASFTVTSAFSSTYDEYLVLVEFGTTSAGANAGLTLGANASYRGNAIVMADTGTTVTGANYNTSTSMFVGYVATDGGASQIFISNPNKAKKTVVKATNTGFITTQANNLLAGNYYDTATTAHTAFTITASTGTFTGGNVRVYGYQKS